MNASTKALVRVTSTLNLNPSPPDSGRREKINLYFYSYTSLWYSRVLNTRGGRLLKFFESPPPPDLIKTPPLINFPL